MAKKIKRPPRSGHKDKRGSNPDKENISAETETTEDNVVRSETKGCPHFEKGIDLAKVSSKMSRAENIRCEDCKETVSEKRANKGKAKIKGGSNSDSRAIWVCLQCGHFFCGGTGIPTTPQSHAVRHANQTRHHLAVQYESLHLRWCFPCSQLIPVEEIGENDEINDALCNVVKLVKDESPKKAMVVEDAWFGNGGILTEKKKENTAYFVRGLVNLGNTCFFNSIMQNLFALDGLRNHCLELNESFGPLTMSFKKIFVETISEYNLKYLLNPRSLFDCVCAKAPQFKGYEQHDSHELLRFLLDGLCTEELSFTKQFCIENQGPAFVDAIFGGQLLSIVSCLDCGHSSKVLEPFLDLSLPVPTKKIPPKKFSEQISLAKTQKLPRQRKNRYLPVVNGAASYCAENREPVEREAGEAVNDLSGQSMGPQTKKASSSHQMVVDKGKPFLENTTNDLTWLDMLEPEVVSYDNDVTWNFSTKMTNEESGVQLLHENVTNDLTWSDKLESHIVSYENGTASNCDVTASRDARERDHGVASSSQVLNCTVTATCSSENFPCLDFVDPNEYQVVNGHEMVSEIDDSLVNLDIGEEVKLSNDHRICAESNYSPGYSFENDLRVQDSEYIYKEESCSIGEVLSGENKIKNTHDIVLEFDDCLADLDIGGEINQSVPKADSMCEESNCSPGNSFENDLQVQDSEYIYIEENCSIGEVLSGEKKIKNAHDIVPEFDDCLGNLDIGGEINQSVPKADSICAESNCSPGYSFENDLRVQDSEYIYKEESCSIGEVLSGENKIKNAHDIVPEFDDCLVNLDIGGEINQSVPKGDSICAESNCSPEYSYENEQPLQDENSVVLLLPYKEDTCSNNDKITGNSFEDEKPFQIKSSEVMLFPYKEESGSNGEILTEEGKFFSSAIGCEQDSFDFSGFGDLFNEPNLVEGPSVNPITGEADTDEVDNSNFQVSVESCLAYFTKPELLSTSEHGWICENCSKSLQEQKRQMKKKHNKAVDKIELNGVEDRVNDSNGGIMKGIDSLVVSEENDAISKKIDFPLKISSFEENKDGLSQFTSEENVSDHYSANEVQILSKGFKLEANGVEEVNFDRLKVERDAMKRILIKKAPSILTIHLKRFSQDSRGRLSKLNGHVDFKDAIDMTPYMYMYSRCNDTEEYKYRLSGVVEHSGTMRGGHYVAYIRGSKNSLSGDNYAWYYASDASVRQVSLQEVLQCEAYILFYEKT